MGKSTYPEAEDGEWILPVANGHRHQCCDCGLVHKVDYRIVDGKVEFRSTRDGRATGQVRRHLKAK